jgi:hypothetical protein
MNSIAELLYDNSNSGENTKQSSKIRTADF